MPTMATATEMITLPYVQVPETSEPLYWADLVALDLFKFDRPGGKQELARELSKAIQRIGMSCLCVLDIPSHI